MMMAYKAINRRSPLCEKCRFFSIMLRLLLSCYVLLFLSTHAFFLSFNIRFAYFIGLFIDFVTVASYKMANIPHSKHLKRADMNCFSPIFRLIISKLG